MKNRIKIAHLIVFSGFFALLAPSPARANEQAGEWNKGACKADADKLCSGVTAGHGAVRDCLKQHEAELSADCKTNIAMAKEKMKEQRQEIQAACKADQDQFCKDVTPGEGREMACLHAHSDKVSAGCKEVMQKAHKHMGMGHPGATTPPAAK